LVLAHSLETPQEQTGCCASANIRMRKERTILHIDMDCFFAAIEQRDNPNLRNRPVIVCGDPQRRSVVSTASYEARRFGVTSGNSVFLARLRCPDAVFVEGNPDKYLFASTRMVKILKDYTPQVELFSVDEAFLDITGSTRLFGSSENVAWSIKRRIREELDLGCSIGIAPNKLLAKIASGLHKPDGLTVVLPGEEQSFLDNLPVEKLWGVGEKTQRVLAKLGVRTVFDLRLVPREVLVQYFGVVGDCLYLMARGIDQSPVIPYYQPQEPKSMGHEFTFARDVANVDCALATLLSLSDKVARRLRQDGWLAASVTLKLRFADFKTITRSSTLRTPTNWDRAIFAQAKSLLLSAWDRRRPLRLIGVTAGRLIRSTDLQLELFDLERAERYRRVVEAVDRIRDRFGERAIGYAASLGRYPAMRGGTRFGPRRPIKQA